MYEECGPGDIKGVIQDGDTTNRLSGVLVELFTCDGTFVTDETTDGNGFFMFVDYPAEEDYYLELHETGYVDGRVPEQGCFTLGCDENLDLGFLNMYEE